MSSYGGARDQFSRSLGPVFPLNLVSLAGRQEVEILCRAIVERSMMSLRISMDLTLEAEHE